MTNIIIVRHGEVAGNAGDKKAFVGWGDLELNERGLRQTEVVGQYLQNETIDAVYSSDLQRARITAESIAAPHNLAVQVDPDLREVNYGDWEGLSEAELLEQYGEQWKARQNDPWNVAAIGGENHAQMWARFLPKWNALVEKHDGQTAVLVGHNGLIRILLCHLLGAPFSSFKRIHVNNCSVTRVEIEAGSGDAPQILIKGINQTSHLQHIL
jgi:broad specificity phosphatase PhoE